MIRYVWVQAVDHGNSLTPMPGGVLQERRKIGPSKNDSKANHHVREEKGQVWESEL
jgi:hypothetical protein